MPFLLRHIFIVAVILSGQSVEASPRLLSPGILQSIRQGAGAFFLPRRPNLLQVCFERPDQDGDCIADARDNCRAVQNADQSDQDGDQIGDVCDVDRDGDGLTNDFEEATVRTDPDNWDSDGDQVSDLLDCDRTNPEKGIASDCSALQIVHNPPLQLPAAAAAAPAESDDSFADDDSDGVINAQDNCRKVFNPGQQDQDGDGIGDLCDNQFHIAPQVLVVKGGGGDFGGCSLVPQRPTNPR